MTKVVDINERGTLTLPKGARARLGIFGRGEVIVRETAEGVLIQSAAVFPIEIYSPDRLKEFNRNNEEALAPYISDISSQKKRKKK